MHYPDYRIAGMYVDQPRHAGDLSRELSKDFDFTLHDTVAGALTLGGERLAVDGVLLIGEHGDYPYNDRGQKLYPRYELFQRIVEVFRKSNRTVPVICDKHLYYDRRRAREMYDTARKLGFGLMAGSSLPVTWRRPELELPVGVRLREALVASRGELEIFGIHALEALQCMAERRTRGEQGVRAVRCLEGDEVWKAGDAGAWSWELLEHALGRSPSLNVGELRRNCRHWSAPPGRPSYVRGPILYQVEYRDGLRVGADPQRSHRRHDVRGPHRGRAAAGVDAVPPARPARRRLPAGADDEDRGLPRDGPAVAADRAHAAHRRHPRRGAGVARPQAPASGNARSRNYL